MRSTERAKNLEGACFIGGVESRCGVREQSELLGHGAVIRSLPGVGRMLWHSRWSVGETEQRVLDIARHGHVARAIDEIPMKGETAILRAGPIFADLVRLLEGVDWMVCVSTRSVSNAEVVDDGAEHDVAGDMPPQTMHQRTRFVAVRFEKHDELIIGNASSLRETVHATSNFDVDVAVVEQGV